MKWFVLCGLLTFGAAVLSDVINVPGDQATIQAGIDGSSSGGQMLPDSGGWVNLEPLSHYMSRGENLICGKHIRFQLRVSNFTGSDVAGMTNGFELYSSDGAVWQEISGMWNPAIDWSCWTVGYATYLYSATGSGADTIGFISAALLGGYYSGRSDVAFLINTRVECDQIGKTICLDSSYFPQYGTWRWGSVIPSWDGPHCWTISSCCTGLRGNVDFSVIDPTNVADVVALVDYLFQGGPPPYCDEEADVDGNGQWDVADLSYLVDYLFRGGPAPLPCL